MNTTNSNDAKMEALNQLENVLGPNAKLPLTVIDNPWHKGFISIENAKNALSSKNYDYETVDGQKVFCAQNFIQVSF